MTLKNRKKMRASAEFIQRMIEREKYRALMAPFVREGGAVFAGLFLGILIALVVVAMIWRNWIWWTIDVGTIAGLSSVWLPFLCGAGAVSWIILMRGLLRWLKRRGPDVKKVTDPALFAIAFESALRDGGDYLAGEIIRAINSAEIKGLIAARFAYLIKKEEIQDEENPNP